MLIVLSIQQTSASTLCDRPCYTMSAAEHTTLYVKHICMVMKHNSLCKAHMKQFVRELQYLHYHCVWLSTCSCAFSIALQRVLRTNIMARCSEQTITASEHRIDISHSLQYCSCHFQLGCHHKKNISSVQSPTKPNWLQYNILR
jgi:hypothetical protein